MNRNDQKSPSDRIEVILLTSALLFQEGSPDSKDSQLLTVLERERQMQKMAREQMRSGRRRVGSGSSQEGSGGGGRPRSATWSHDEVKKRKALFSNTCEADNMPARFICKHSWVLEQRESSNFFSSLLMIYSKTGLFLTDDYPQS